MSFFKKSKLDDYSVKVEKTERHYTVLLVDDEPANLKVMSAILAPHYEVLTASDGLDALKLIEQLDNYDKLACIISDQRMPNMTGVQLFTKVRDIVPDTLRTIVTGYIDLDAIVDSVNNASIYKFIIKPFDFNDFLLSTQAAVELFDMKVKMKRYQQTLEADVKSRTLELAQVNELLVEGVAELEQTYADVLNLNQLANELSQCSTVEQALKAAVKCIPTLLPQKKGALCLLNEEGCIAQLEQWQQRFYFIGQKINEETLISQGLDLFPIEHQDAILGYLMIESVNTSEADKHLIKPLAETVSKQLSLSIANLLLRESLLQQSIIDPLTQTYNRRYMDETLKRELARADREGSSIAIIMIDVDHFKPFNDNYGHDFGDQVLTRLAEAIKNRSRGSDTVCRFGGEEFIVLLPNADAAAASKKAEELRALVADLQFTNDEGDTVNVTISLGVACYPEHAANEKKLLKVVDDALYQAKGKGRNCWVLAT